MVLNRAKLAYNGVAVWLEGQGPAPQRLAAVAGLDEQLRVQDRVAQAMKNLRHQHGALSLETLEARAVFDGDVLADLVPDEQNRAKELIEDFMIAANGATAKFLEQKGCPSLRRVLRTPKRWQRIVELAAGRGIDVGRGKTARRAHAVTRDSDRRRSGPRPRNFSQGRVRADRAAALRATAHPA